MISTLLWILGGYYVVAILAFVRLIIVAPDPGAAQPYPLPHYPCGTRLYSPPPSSRAKAFERVQSERLKSLNQSIRSPRRMRRGR